MAENDDKKEKKKAAGEEKIQFQLSEEDLEAIADAKSETVPNLPLAQKTPFTIENAPVAKSIMRHPFPVQRKAPAQTPDDEPNDE